MTRPARSRLRRAALGGAGLALGGVFLHLALRRFDGDEVRAALADLDHGWLGVAAAVYWLAIALRVARWSVLLGELGAPALRHVAETLVVGYAVNNVLPARLGEVFRADYARRRFRIPGGTALGSIVIERLLDLAAILGCFGAGLVYARALGAGGLLRFETVALNAGAVVGALVLAVGFLRARKPAGRRLPAIAAALLDDVVHGLAALNRRSLGAAVVLSALVWAAEAATLWAVFRAFGLTLAAHEVLIVMGAASLSTLVPTAPGYLGSFQLVFALTLGALGRPGAVGVAAASVIQALLFGTVSVVGLGLLALRSLHTMQREAASTR